LKPEWLDYAALDVAVLLDIRDGVERLLLESGKLDWAREEFENSLKVFPAKIKRDPWRRTSGMHQIKSRFELALIRELWLARDKVARDLDIAPGRLLSDSVIVELSRKKPESYEELLKLSIIREKIRHDDQKSQLKNWWRVLSGAYEMDQDHWPEMRARGDGLPQPRIWRDKFPIAYIHYQHARLNLGAVAQELNIPLENLVSPDLVRRITFDDGQERIYRDLEKSKVAIEVALREGNARDWQIRLTSEPLARSLAQTEAPELPEEPAGEE
jgi:ribonuclease D